MEPTTKALHDYPELMTVAETADYLRIAVSTCYLLTNSAGSERKLPAVKVGGRTFIRRRLERCAMYG